MKDYYKVLDVPKDIDADKLKDKYRDLAHKWHPDKHQQGTEEAKAGAEERFKEISEAYSVLSDEEKRANYDATGSPDGLGPFGSRSGGFKTTGDPFEMFRRFGGFEFNSGPQAPRPMKGQNVQNVLDITLKESLFGAERQVEYDVSSACETCDGDGATEFESCTVCNGVGIFTQQQGNMIMQQNCGGCRGKGKKAKSLCSTCGGQGIQHLHNKLNVVIPKSIHNGVSLRLAGKGGRGFNGGPFGDMFLTVRVNYPDITQLSEEEREQLDKLLSK